MIEHNANNNNGNEPPAPPERTSSYNMYNNTTPGPNRKTVSFVPSTNGQNNAPPTPGVVGAQERIRVIAVLSVIQIDAHGQACADGEREERHHCEREEQERWLRAG